MEKMLKEYKGHLCGRYLDDKTCERLLKLHELNRRGGSIDWLKNIIYDLTPEQVEKIKKEKTSDNIEDKRKGELTNLQTIGVAYMYLAQRVLMGDSVGFGKTPQSAGLIKYLESKLGRKIRYLYCTKKTLIEKDQNELIRFTGDYVHLLKGETAYLKRELKKETPYSFVAVHSVIKNPVFQEWVLLHEQFPFDVVIIDESSYVGTASDKTDIYKSAQELCKMAGRVVLLNATPFGTNLDSFRNQLILVDDTFLPTKMQFKKMFQKTRWNGEYAEYIEEYKNEDVFREAIKLRCLSRKRNEHKGIMENCEARLIEVTKSATQRRLEKLSSLPQMVYDCPSAIDRDVEMTEITTPKLKVVKELIANEGANENSILIYCNYKESQEGILNILKKEGYSCAKLNGDTSTEERKQLIEEFKTGAVRVLVTNVQEGLNFGNCNFLIFYSALPNPSKMVQVEGRITRSFDIRDKRVFLLATKGRELRTIKDVIAGRAKASEQFAGSDYSMILDLLKGVGE